MVGGKGFNLTNTQTMKHVLFNEKENFHPNPHTDPPTHSSYVLWLTDWSGGLYVY